MFRSLTHKQSRTMKELTTLFLGTCIVSNSALSQFAHSFDAMKQMNPAMAGMDYKSNANLILAGGDLKNAFGQDRNLGIMGNYSIFLEKSKIGVGVSSFNLTRNYKEYYLYSDNLTQLGLNKQFALKNNLRFSTGLGAGLKTETIRLRDYGEDWVKFSQSQAIQFELGTVLQSERFQVGVSIGYQFALTENIEYLNDLFYNFSASYTFGRADGLQFTPHALLSQIGPAFGGTLKYNSKYLLGGGVSNQGFKSSSNGTPYVTAGYTIRDKFSINYSYNFKATHYKVFTPHAIILSLKLGKR